MKPNWTSNLFKNIKLYIIIHWKRLLVASLLGIILSCGLCFTSGVLFQIPIQYYTSDLPSELSAISISCIVIGSIGIVLFFLPLVISIIYFIVKWRREQQNPFSVHSNFRNKEEEEENYLYSNASSNSSSTHTSPTSYYQSQTSTPISSFSEESEKTQLKRKNSVSLGMKLPSSGISIAQETYDTVQELQLEEKYRAISSLALIPIITSVLLIFFTILSSILGFILFWVSFALYFPPKMQETSQTTIATSLALFALFPLLFCCPMFACISLIPIDIRKSLFKTTS